MDNDLIKSIAIGIAAGLGSAALLPMLFKGSLLFKRELDRVEAAHAKAEAAWERERDRLQDALEASQRSDKEKDGIIVEQSKQVFTAINILGSLKGLIALERRAPHE